MNSVVVNAEAQTIFFQDDEYLYDSTMVKVDDSGPRLRNRFKNSHRGVEFTKVSTTILAIHLAFKDFAKAVLYKLDKVVQSREQFQPYKKGFVVNSHEMVFCMKYAS